MSIFKCNNCNKSLNIQNAPKQCPYCKAESEKFIYISYQVSDPNLCGKIKTFKCKTCGCQYKGIRSPGKCLVCKNSGFNFETISDNSFFSLTKKSTSPSTKNSLSAKPSSRGISSAARQRSTSSPSIYRKSNSKTVNKFSVKFLYHKFNSHHTFKNGKIFFMDGDGNNTRLFKRKYDFDGAYFYIYSHIFPTMYIYSGDFIGQLYNYCQVVKSKCSSSSIKKAFSECPNLLELIDNDKFNNCHLEDIKINGCKKKCLAVCYPSFLLTKQMMYNRLAEKEESLKKEIKKIKKYELRDKWATLKKIGAGALKVGAKIGVAMAAGFIGANLDFDLPDFDFGNSAPDIDIDFDADFDTDLDNQLAYDTDYNGGYNVAFGASPNADGYIPDGTISLDRTLSDRADTFPHYKKDGHDFVKIGSNYIRIDKGLSVFLNNIKYDTI